MHIDCFTSLDELKNKDQGDTVKVLRVLHRVKRFSVWDASENPTIARTMGNICKSKLIETDISCGFPWTECRLTPSGLKMIGAPESEIIKAKIAELETQENKDEV
jgi:hypothetical protein